MLWRLRILTTVTQDVAATSCDTWDRKLRTSKLLSHPGLAEGKPTVPYIFSLQLAQFQTFSPTNVRRIPAWVHFGTPTSLFENIGCLPDHKPFGRV